MATYPKSVFLFFIFFRLQKSKKNPFLQYCVFSFVKWLKISLMRPLPTLLAIVLTITILLTSCKPDDLTPAYLQIDYYDVNYNPETGVSPLDVSTYNEVHGENYDSEQLRALMQHTFTHVNVYANSKNLGCWKLPCKVPILHVPDADSSDIIILPAFPLNGMTNTISGYPFFNVLKKKMMLKRGETCKVTDYPLKFIYNSVTKIPFMETFTNSSPFMASDTSNTHTFQPIIVDGLNVGEIVLQNSESFDVHTGEITLPVGNYFVYLEMTYRVDNNMELGMKISTASSPYTVHQIGGVFPTNGEWKTVCFRLGGIINDYHNTSSSVTNATLVLTGIGKDGGPTRFDIDDIKIIYSPRA